MTKEQVMRLQRSLKEAGFYEATVDGLWGSQSQGAFDTALAATKLRCEFNVPEKVSAQTEQKLGIAWSAKVSQVFVDRVIWICNELGLPKDSGPHDLMACIAWESGETFSPAIKNGAGSGATGLIQFMPATAVGLGTTVEALAKMSAEDQLNYVYRYFLPYKNRLKNLGDIYMAILWPAGVGKADDWVLWGSKSHPTTYRQNAGLDVNKDGIITRGECLKKVTEKLIKGMQPQNRRAL